MFYTKIITKTNIDGCTFTLPTQDTNTHTEPEDGLFSVHEATNMTFETSYGMAIALDVEY